MEERNLIQHLIEKGVLTKEGMRAYLRETDLKPSYSEIKDGVLVKFDSRDLVSGRYVTPLGVTAIGDKAFSYNQDIKSIGIRKDVKKIGTRAFLGCDHLRKIEMTNAVQELGSEAFSSCGELEFVKLSKNIKRLPYCVFADCCDLTALILPEALERIEDNAFYNCTGLTLISNPTQNLKWVSRIAFNKCPVGGDYLMIYDKIQEQKKEKSEVTPK